MVAVTDWRKPAQKEMDPASMARNQASGAFPYGWGRLALRWALAPVPSRRDYRGLAARRDLAHLTAWPLPRASCYNSPLHGGVLRTSCPVNASRLSQIEICGLVGHLGRKPHTHLSVSRVGTVERTVCCVRCRASATLQCSLSSAEPRPIQEPGEMKPSRRLWGGGGTTKG